jgi:hypothetical protein
MSDSYNISGNIAAQTVAVGTGSTIFASGNATVGQSNGAEVGALLDQLQQAIEAFQGPPETRAKLMSEHAQIAEELQRPSPSKSKVMEKLTALGHIAGPAASIAQAIAAFIPVVAALV